MSSRTPTADELAQYAHEYVRNGGNKTRAWQSTFPNNKAALSSAWVSGSEFHKNPGVEDAIAKAHADYRAAAKEKFNIEAEDVLTRWWELATADTRELVQVKHNCCRYCHGFDHEYQWVDEKEFDASKGEDDCGGYGYNPDIPPDPDCPRCFGDGATEVWLADTRNLPPQAAALFAGARQTRNGIEIKIHDQQAALERLARAMGLFTDNLNVQSLDGSMPPKKNFNDFYRDESGD